MQHLSRVQRTHSNRLEQKLGDNMFTKYVLPAIIIGVAIVLAVIIVVASKSSSAKEDKIHKISTTDGFIKKPYYIKHQNIDMFKAIREVMPDNVNVQVKVTLDTFIKYNGFDVDKKRLLTKYVDIVLFNEEDFTPILAIDLYNYDTTLESMHVMRGDIVNLLNSCGVPCISLPLELAQDKPNLQNTLLNTIRREDLIKLGVNDEQ